MIRLLFLVLLLPAAALAAPSKDTDGDGLTDEAELLAGTDRFVADCDGDGLTDFEEVVLLGTDPWSADGDGDGGSDVAEASAGDPTRFDAAPKVAAKPVVNPIRPVAARRTLVATAK